MYLFLAELNLCCCMDFFLVAENGVYSSCACCSLGVFSCCGAWALGHMSFRSCIVRAQLWVLGSRAKVQ